MPDSKLPEPASGPAGELPEPASGPAGELPEPASRPAGELPGAWGPPLAAHFYDRDSVVVAPQLLNKILVCADGRAGRIIEVEAYRGVDDPASHAYRGRTTRNATMWGPPGRLYTYFTYGMHWCTNTVTAPEGHPQAVLLRALHPLTGLDAMRAERWRNQRRQRDLDLCRGPGRLCQAFGIGASDNGVDLTAGTGLWVAEDGTPPPTSPGQGTRIGISSAQDRQWRFWIDGHPGISGR